jgi:hypothetical protein
MGREAPKGAVVGEVVKCGERVYALCPGKSKIQDRYFHFLGKES